MRWDWCFSWSIWLPLSLTPLEWQWADGVRRWDTTDSGWRGTGLLRETQLNLQPPQNLTFSASLTHLDNKQPLSEPRSHIYCRCVTPSSAPSWVNPTLDRTVIHWFCVRLSGCPETKHTEIEMLACSALEIREMVMQRNSFCHCHEWGSSRRLHINFNKSLQQLCKAVRSSTLSWIQTYKIRLATKN